MKSDAIIGAVEGVTKKWAKQRKREERESSARVNRHYAMTRSYHTSIRDAAYEAMEDAYMKASANGTLPAHARQIMYAARGSIQRNADRPLGKKFSQYFTQQLLPNYIEDHGVDWNVVFDARGNFHEPHTGKSVPLGTLQVGGYLHDVEKHEVEELNFNVWKKYYPTLGPKNRYGAILFIEKEGFMPLFEAVDLAARYDIAIMSTKGMSVTASRSLVDTLCAEHSVPLLVLHDFDKAGFSIVGTLKRDTRRYTFMNDIEVVDLGMGMGDIEGLEVEEVYIESHRAARWNLQENGASPEEIEFLLHRRVELNAFPSDDLIKWIERKLKDQGVGKVVPTDDCLADAYDRAVRQTLAQDRIDEAMKKLDKNRTKAQAPAKLREKVAAQLRMEPGISWDTAIKRIVNLERT